MTSVQALENVIKIINIYDNKYTVGTVEHRLLNKVSCEIYKFYYQERDGNKITDSNQNSSGVEEITVWPIKYTGDAMGGNQRLVGYVLSKNIANQFCEDYNRGGWGSYVKVYEAIKVAISKSPKRTKEEIERDIIAEAKQISILTSYQNILGNMKALTQELENA